jgi:hypothetical protein
LSVIPIALVVAFGVHQVRKSIVRRMSRESATLAD